MEKRICKLESCGKEFMPTIHNHRYCTRECHKKAIEKRKPYPKNRILNCKHCNKEFTPNGKCRKYCSEQCSIEYSKKNNKQNCAEHYAKNKDLRAQQSKIYREKNHEELRIKKIEYYQKNIETILNEENRKKRAEYSKYYSKTEQGILSSKKNNHQRRAKTFSAKIGIVDFEFIINRDCQICQLCKEKIDLTLKKPDPMCLNFDHIIPLSKGGEHCNSNIQLAHQKCNLHKSAKIL